MHNQNMYHETNSLNQIVTTYNWLENCNHNIKVKAFIFHISNYLFPQLIFVEQFNQNFHQGLPKLSIASKSPIAICFDFQSTPKKLSTNAKMSWTSLNIQRSKLAIAKWHFTKDNMTYNFSVFSTRPCRISYENLLLEGNTTLGHKWKPKTFD